MAEVLDLAEMTWGELKARLKQQPELADHPSVKALHKRMEDLTRFPAFEALDKAIARWSKPLTSTPVHQEGPSIWNTIRIPKAPDPGQGTDIAMLREVERLTRKVDELTALIEDNQRSAEDRHPIAAGEASATKTSGQDAQPLKPSAPPKRDAGRPTRNEEILLLLRERWPIGKKLPHKLAEEARQIRVALCERYKDGIQDGEPHIPVAASIENIIRQAYKALRIRRNTVK
jgi:hypothetical protein